MRKSPPIAGHICVRVVVALLLGGLSVRAAEPEALGQKQPGNPAAPAAEEAKTAGAPSGAPNADANPDAEQDQRSQLNLLGQTNTAAGENRRNENVQFNLIDNNALKDLNVRLGTKATIIPEFFADKRYFGSEFGNVPRPAIHLADPGLGGQKVHGEFFYSHLNSATTARSFFQVGDVKPAREHDYGFRVSTPLWRGANLSANGGQTKIHGQVNGNVLIPLPGERTPLTDDPALVRQIMKVFSAYPDELPNRPDIAKRMLNTNSPQEIDNDTIGGHLDQRFGGRDQLLLRYEFLKQKVRAFQFVKGQNPDMQTRSHLARATWTRVWSPNTITDLSAGFSRVGSLLQPEKDFIGMRVSVSSVYERLGPGNSIPIDRAQNDYRWAGKLTAIRGRHQLFFGAGGLRRQLNGIESDAHLGHFNFNNNFGADAITNLRLGRPSSYFAGVGFLPRGFRFTSLDAYVSDKWRVNSRLTMTMGLRWEGRSAPSEVNHLNEFPYQGDYNNFGPMFSLAYDLGGRRGVLRAAYGIHFGEIFAVTAQQIRFNAPLNYKLVIQNPDFADPLAGIGGKPPADTRSVLYDYAPDLVSPYAHQYNFSWEFTPVGELAVQLGYIGSRSLKLLHHWYMNRAHPVEGIPLETGTIDERRADPRYADVRRVVNGSRGYFDAFKATVTLPRAKGLSGEASYWFSKALDLGSSYTNTAYGLDSFRNGSQYEFEVHHDLKGPSRFHQPHAFLARGTYEFPYRAHSGWRGAVFADWSVSGVLLLKSGTPFSLSTGSDAPGYGNVDGIRSDRPNVVDPSILHRAIDHPDRSVTLLPRDAFSFIPVGENHGNLGRNTFRRGAIHNINLALSKSWRLQPEKELTLRAESINFFNTPQFAEPGTSLTDSNFAVITNTLNEGRTYRFLLQFGF